MNNDPITDEVDQFNQKNGSYLLRSISFLVTLLLIGLLFTLENPTSGGPRVVIFALVLIFLLMFQIVWTALHLLTVISGKSTKIRHPLLFSQLVAFSCIFLIGLQSLNQLGITDVLLTITLVLITYFYIIRRF